MKKITYIAYSILGIVFIGIICFFTIHETDKSISNINETTTVESTTVQETTKVSQETTTKQQDETITKKIVPKANYTDNDVYLLAQILYCEAGGCGSDEMAKVGQVVLNRMNTQYWEFASCNTIYEVLCQANSYPTTLRKIRNGVVPSKLSMQVAEGLLNGTLDSGLSKNVFWQTGSKPSWNATVVLKTKWHYYSELA